MNDNTEIDRTSAKYAYEQVADTIAARIAARRYTIKLPRELDLAEEFGVSYRTVRYAIAILRERGLIVTVHGRGTFVAESRTAGDDEEALCSEARRMVCARLDWPEPQRSEGFHE